MSPVEVERSRPVAVIGWDVADELFGQTEPLDKIDQRRRRALPRRRHQREEGLVLRQLAGRLRGHPAGRLPEAVRRAAVAADRGQAAEPAGDPGRQGRRHRGAAGDAAAQARRRRQLRDVHLRHLPGPLPPGDDRHLRRPGRRRGAVAGRRRHRDHEHHADGGQRAHARNRAAQGARARGGPTSCRRCSPSRSRCRSSAASSG